MLSPRQHELQQATPEDKTRTKPECGEQAGGKHCPLESKSQNKVLKHIKKSNVMKTKYIIIGTETEF